MAGLSVRQRLEAAGNPSARGEGAKSTAGVDAATLGRSKTIPQALRGGTRGPLGGGGNISGRSTPVDPKVKEAQERAEALKKQQEAKRLQKIYRDADYNRMEAARPRGKSATIFAGGTDLLSTPSVSRRSLMGA